ncbi:hypothetical protein [Paenibacillus taichungensis]|jgi:hypothetical protein
MNKMVKGYLLKDRGTVVTDKSLIENAKDDEFVEVSIIITMEEIQGWNEEIEMMGLDEESEEDRD